MSKTASPPAFSSKYAVTVAPSRRPPPTSLHLIQGPLPVRSKPKHTLPSLPRPAFYPKVHVPKDGPEVRARRKARDVVLVDEHRPHGDFPVQVALQLSTRLRSNSSRRSSLDSTSSEGSSSSGNSSPVSEAGSFHSVPTSPGVYALLEQKFVRGPWDHSGAIRVPFDVNAVLAPPRPVAVNPY